MLLESLSGPYRSATLPASTQTASFADAVSNERSSPPAATASTSTADGTPQASIYGPYLPGTEPWAQPTVDPNDRKYYNTSHSTAESDLTTKAAELERAKEELAGLREEGASEYDIAAQQRVVTGLQQDVADATETAVNLTMDLENDPTRKTTAGAEEITRLADSVPESVRPYVIDAGQRAIIAKDAAPPTLVTTSCTAAPQYVDAPASEAPPPLTVGNDVTDAIAPVVADAEGRSDREAEATLAAANEILWGEQAAENSEVAQVLEADAEDAKAVFGESSPEYAAARGEADAAWSRAEAAGQQTELHATQFAVYRLDPAYQSATAAAESAIDEAVAPLGLQWSPPAAEGSLGDMQERLQTVEGLATLANQAANERTLASHELDLWMVGSGEVSELQRQVESYDHPVASPVGEGPDMIARGLDQTDAEKERDVVAAQTNLHLGQSNVHATRADLLTLEYREQAAQLAIDETQLGSEERAAAEEDLAAAQDLQPTAQDNHEVAVLERDYAKTVEIDALLEQEGQSLRREAIESQRERLPHLFENGYTDAGGDAHVRLQDIEYEVREDGQLYQVNHYENGTMDYQLTYDPGEVSDRTPESQRQLYDAWSTYYPQQQQAGRDVLAAQRALAERQREDLDVEIGRLEQDYQSALDAHGDGIGAPEGSPLGTDDNPIQPVAYSEPAPVHPAVTEARSALDAAYQESEALDLHLDYLDFVLSQPDSAREDPEELEARFYEENEEHLRPTFNDFGEQDIYRERQFVNAGGELEDLVAGSYGFEDSGSGEAQEAIAPALEEIRNVTGGGDGETVAVNVVPFVYLDASVGKQDRVLFEIEGEDGSVLVDDSGSRYDDVEDFQHNNYLSEDGRIYLPQGLDVTPDANGNVAYEGMQAHIRGFTERVLDPVMSVTAGVATIASFTPLAPVAAPIAYGSGTYLGVRSAMKLKSMHDHGRDIISKEGIMEMAMVATAALPLASSLARFGGLARSGMTMTAAARSSVGAIRVKDVALCRLRLPATPYAAEASQLMRQGGLLFTSARGFDYTAMAIGVPLIGQSAYDLAVHGGDMTGFERLTSFMNLAGGIYGTGMGYRGWRAMRRESPAGTQTDRPETAAEGTQVGRPEAGTPKRPSLWSRMPDLRFGVQLRLRANTDLATGPAADLAGLPSDRAQTGHPTLASFGVALSTKSSMTAVFRSGGDGAPPLRQRLGEQVITSVRPHEYQNITLAQLGLSPASNQTVFQLKGASLLEIGCQVLFEDAAGAPFVVMPRGAKVVGPAADGSGTVVELDYSLRLAKGEELATLPPGEQEFFGVSGDSRRGFVRLPGDLAYSKIMEELKLTARPRLLASNVPFVSKFIPRLGFERRPEVTFSEGAVLPAGTLVTREFYEQHQAMLDRTNLRTQFVVCEQADAARLVFDPRVSDIRAFAGAGRVNAASAVSYVPGVRSGLRLSAIPGKPSEARFTALTGDQRWTWDSNQTNLDIVFNDFYPLGSRNLPNPDRAISRLPAAATLGLPQGGSLPTDGNVYRSIFGRRASFASPATRYTLSLSTPYITPGIPGIKLLQSPFSASIELRMQWKRDAKPSAPAVSEAAWTQRRFTDPGGLPVELNVPGWLATAITWSPGASHVLVPTGGRESLRRFIAADLEPRATPLQRRAIEDFRLDVLPEVRDQRFLSRSTFDRIDTFLAGQARPGGHLPPAGFTHLAAPELQGPLEAWYARNEVAPTPRRDNPMPLWNAGRGEVSSLRPALTPEELAQRLGIDGGALPPDGPGGQGGSGTPSGGFGRSLLTYTGLTGASALAWRYLPPEALVTLSAGGWGLRGLGFSAQALFYRATSRPGASRALSTIYALTFPLNIADGSAKAFGGVNPLVNGAFAAGSLPFNAQAAQEALTGRPAPRRRWTNHFAYASYAGGSAVYLAQSMASGGVVPIIAGALFTGGTIMLWPGAVKPRPRPVDPASPQSAKPWLPSRLALGGGFGVGLLLFSGMTLAGEPWKSDDGDGSAAPGVGGSDPGNAPGTEPPPPVRPEPAEQPEEERPLMLVVLPADGLRLRESPAADAPVQAVFLHGTFVEDLGRRQTDKAGDTWVAVCGRTADQRELEGWVMARYVEAHSSGAMSGLGRINPALEEQGYVWVPVQLGDTMSGIVQDEASNFAVAAMLNDHIIDPDHLYVGDRIYLPG